MNKSDTEKTVCGVPGRLTHATVKPGQAPGLWFLQRWISDSRPAPKGYQDGARIRAEIRFDDECGNGHNSFAVTGDVFKPVQYRGKVRSEDIAGGCLHEDIAAAFPELAHLIRWHLFDQTGPMHYVANATYFAGDRDHWGTRKGEPRRWDLAIQFGENPIRHTPGRGGAFLKFLNEHRPLFQGGPAYDFEVLPYEHENRSGETYKFGPKYTFGGFADKWHECPFDTEQEALDFLYALNNCQPKFIRVATSFGEGKERELDKARSVAVWPEATDAELSADKETLTAALLARLPALVAAFRADIEAAGFDWAPSETAEA
jgi:hypothetical protein